MTKMMFSLVAALIGSLLFAPAPAHADVQNIATAPMVRVGVDHAVAAAHGFEVRTDARGVEYAVRPGTPQTEGYKDGVCGWSWVYFTAIDPAQHTTMIRTGFDVKAGWAGAVFVHWRVGVIDSYGSSVKTSIGRSNRPYEWSDEYWFKSKGPGPAYADVLLTSAATLWDGTVCYSHGPTDSKYL